MATQSPSFPFGRSFQQQQQQHTTSRRTAPPRTDQGRLCLEAADALQGAFSTFLGCLDAFRSAVERANALRQKHDPESLPNYAYAHSPIALQAIVFDAEDQLERHWGRVEAIGRSWNNCSHADAAADGRTLPAASAEAEGDDDAVMFLDTSMACIFNLLRSVAEDVSNKVCMPPTEILGADMGAPPATVPSPAGIRPHASLTLHPQDLSTDPFGDHAPAAADHTTSPPSMHGVTRETTVVPVGLPPRDQTTPATMPHSSSDFGSGIVVPASQALGSAAEVGPPPLVAKHEDALQQRRRGERASPKTLAERIEACRRQAALQRGDDQIETCG